MTGSSRPTGDVREIVVVGADKAFGVTHIGSTHRHTVVGAAIDFGVDLAVVTHGDDDVGFTHKGGDKVAGLFKLALVRQVQPGFTEDILFLQLVDFFAGKDFEADLTAIVTDQLF